jgi:ABC-type nitrate/sulfonate/bicarbonate transport system substrate-binding protein
MDSTGRLCVDVAIGLTEGWVAGIARGEPVRIIGSYVKSPLRWAISTGPESRYNSIKDLKNSAIGISRIGR